MKSLKSVLSLACLLAAAAPGLKAQQESLLIGPGDMVHVSILDAPELEERARVTDAGELPLMIGGKVKIAGMTPEKAADVIGTDLVAQHLLVNPKILVTVEQYATQNLSILGEVRLPGVYPVTAPKTVAEALALAGGLMPDADRNIVIQRHSTGELVTYYSSNSPLTVPDSAAPGVKPTNASALRSRDTMVYPGDTLRVSRAELVFAIGDFFRPGGFPIVNNDSHLTVLQLVALAGGAEPNARLGQARLVRKLPDGKLEDIKLSLGEMQKGKKPDEVLQANDILYVPFSFTKNAAMGAIQLAAAATNASVFAF
jgi:polysaccharide export outer membrane protein